MNIRDRVRQTATNDGVTPTEFDLSAGVAVTGYRTFADAYDTGSIASGSQSFNDIPLLVEKADGAWQILLCAVTFTWVGPGAGVGTLVASGTLYASSTGSALTFSVDEEVTISLVPAAMLFQTIVMRALAVPSGSENYAGFFPKLNANGLLAAGQNAYATGDGAVAIGDGATAGNTGAFALGAGAFSANPYALVSGAPGAFANGALVHTIGFGQPTGFLAGAMIQYATFDRGVMNGLTTDATPTNLAVDVEGTGALSNSDTLYCDAGLHVIEGDLTAVADNGDMKAWHIKVVVRTELDYSAAAIVGTPVTDELYESAGATTWAATPAVDTGTQEFSLGVTGEAATNITWAFAYTAKYHTVYV